MNAHVRLQARGSTRVALFVAALTLLSATDAWAAFCTGKQNGLWCDGDKLVYCSNGNVSSSQTCSNGCQSMPPGTPDQCKAATGFCAGKASGYWCDGSKLVLCKSGNISSSQSCPNGCQSMPSGTDDKCKEATNFCTGKASGQWCDGSKLVLCKSGNISSSQNCPNGCQSMPSGTDDKCKEATNFCTGKASGQWCDGSKLVLCKSGNISSSQNCPNGCQSMPSGTDDKCKEATNFCTGKASGQWCDGSKLVLCKSGSIASSQNCPNGCQSNPAGTDDTCKAATSFCTGKQNGAWCDGDKLVQCQNGAVSSSQTCANGCQSMPVGVPDQCKATGGTGFCAGKQNGLWCDGDALVNCQNNSVASSQTCSNGCQSMPVGVADQCAPSSGGGGGTGGKLELCNPFNPAKAVTCGFGCYSGHKGSDYACGDGTPLYAPTNGTVTKVVNSYNGQTCSPDFGNLIKIATGPYEIILAHMRKDILVGAGEIQAGTPIGYASNTGYTLTQKNGTWVCQQGGGHHLHLEVRKNGVAVDAYGGEVVWKNCGDIGNGGGGGTTTFCTGKQNGLWCDGSALVDCKDGAVASSQTCSNGCESMPVGVPDQCKSGGGTGFCSGKQNGAWCDGDKLVTCSGGSISASETCADGCESMPVGVPDQCKAKPVTGPCEGVQNAALCHQDAVVICVAGAVQQTITCQFGCVDKAGVVHCNEPAAPEPCAGKGDGASCEGDVLRQCQSGKTASATPCAFGCGVVGGNALCLAKPAPADPCAGLADGGHCEAASLRTCQSGQTVGAITCNFGCAGAPGQGACALPGGQGPCQGKPDGWHCDGSKRLRCAAGALAEQELCAFGCGTFAGQVGCLGVEGAACAAKVDGGVCQGELLLGCAAGQVQSATLCMQGCVADGAAHCAAAAGVCADKVDGAWCDAGALVHCLSQSEVSVEICKFGCLPTPGPVADVCASAKDASCFGKADGTWCDAGAKIVCSGGVETERVACALGCQGPAGQASCSAAAASSCAELEDGTHCAGSAVVACVSGETTLVAPCVNGCEVDPVLGPRCIKAEAAGSAIAVTVDEAGCAQVVGSLLLGDVAHQSQLGSDVAIGACSDRTIASHGALITALSTAYAALGAPREALGVVGNTPPLENLWRNENDGYAACAEAGVCCARWDRNPDPVAFDLGSGFDGACLPPELALRVAASLAAGRPVVAGIHPIGNPPGAHFVTIVGVGEGGWQVLDPKGDAAPVALAAIAAVEHVLDFVAIPRLDGAPNAALSPSGAGGPLPGGPGRNHPSSGADAGGGATGDATGDATGTMGGDAGLDAASDGAWQPAAAPSGCSASPVRGRLTTAPWAWLTTLIAAAWALCFALRRRST
ncbi:MAG: M23 family metallopeptidase [Deltaproteobacteria bacterium]|nr:M23 family metallopeptidase [Deltaproteobacteria bacterium]